MRHCTLTLLILCLATLSSAQKKFDDRYQIDSIKQYISQASTPDSMVSEGYCDLAERYTYFAIDSSYDYVEKAILYAKEANSTKWLALSHLIQGQILGRTSRYQESLVALRYAVEVSTKSEYNEGAEMAYNSIGRVYELLGHYDSAIMLYDAGIKYADSVGKAIFYNNMGIIYKDMGKQFLASDYYMKSIKYLKTAKEPDYYLANFYSNFASLKSAVGNDEEAIVYYRLALKAAKNRGNQYMISSIYDGMGNYQKRRFDFDSAQFYFEVALEIAEKGKMEDRIFSTLFSLCLLSIDKNEMDLAKAYLSKMVLDSSSNYVSYHSALGQYDMANKEYAKSLISLNKCLDKIDETGSVEETIHLFRFKSEAYEGMRDFEQSLVWHKKHLAMKDSLGSKEHQNYISELEEVYEAEKKETEIVKLSEQQAIKDLEINKQRQWLVVVGVSAISLFALGLALYFRSQQKQIQTKVAKVEIEQRFLRSQLNPHFIFNALDSIQNYMLENDAPKAGLYMSKFAKLMRQVLENSRENFIPISEEIKMLENYMGLQQLQSEEKFTYSIQVDEKIELEDFAIPPMFVQPFVENAIEHGVINGNGNISINFQLEGELVNIMVTDNGIGLSESKKIQTQQAKQHNSLATSIIKERIESYNEKLKINIQLLISEIVEENKSVLGTKVELKVPFQRG
jgi:tetratricopeptide (TPR) repeat protein